MDPYSVQYNILNLAWETSLRFREEEDTLGKDGKSTAELKIKQRLS